VQQPERHHKKKEKNENREKQEKKEKKEKKEKTLDATTFKRELHLFNWLPNDKRYVPTGHVYQCKHVKKCAHRVISQGFRQFVLLEFDKSLNPKLYEPVKSVAAFFYVGLPVGTKPRVIKIKDSEFIKDKRIVLVKWNQHLATTATILDVLSRYRPPEIPSSTSHAAVVKTDTNKTDTNKKDTNKKDASKNDTNKKDASKNDVRLPSKNQDRSKEKKQSYIEGKR